MHQLCLKLLLLLELLFQKRLNVLINFNLKVCKLNITFKLHQKLLRGYLSYFKEKSVTPRLKF